MPYSKKDKETVYKTLRKYDGNAAEFVNRYHKRQAVESNKLAYLAGIVDGEGHFKYYEDKDTYILVVGNTSEDLMNWLFDNYGGIINQERILASGKPWYTWRLNKGKDLFYLMLLMIPFLVIKKHIAIECLEKTINSFKRLDFTIKNKK